MTDQPRGRTAHFALVRAGLLTETGGGVVSTCSLVRDGERTIVVDPGMAESARTILEPLAALGVAAEDVTDVVLSHHHPDHTMHAGLFDNAAVHDHWAIYRGTDWEDSDAEGRELTPSVRLIRVPGHTAEDIAAVIETPEGVVVCTHLWFHQDGPVDDPTCEDVGKLHASRQRVLSFADVIVPGHGAAFRPSATTPL